MTDQIEALTLRIEELEKAVKYLLEYNAAKEDNVEVSKKKRYAIYVGRQFVANIYINRKYREVLRNIILLRYPFVREVIKDRDIKSIEWGEDSISPYAKITLEE